MRSVRGLVIAAPSSGQGKTTATLAILRALARRGVDVRPFKAGPDYIDPRFLAAAAGREARNLDPWGMRAATLRGQLATAAGADLALVEGATGLFDGALDGTGSTADLAAMFGLPVVLVVDARGMGASAAALVDGFRRHRGDVDVAAVLLNRVGSARHEGLLRRALGGVEVVGCLPRDDGLVVPSRHLGLVQAAEHPGLEVFLERAADLADAGVDLARLTALARPARLDGDVGDTPLPPLGQRIAVARDEAFAFAYPAVLEGWRQAGAEVVPFSPLGDEGPDVGADAVYLPGGYPELHAGRLAGNGRFLAGLRAAAGRGAFIYGECGGYMALGERLVDREGCSHAMAGLLPVVTSFAEPRRHLGYREIVAAAGTRLGEAGARFRGHEFHYASELERQGAALFGAWGADGERLGERGCVVGSVAGSFLHLVDRL